MIKSEDKLKKLSEILLKGDPELSTGAIGLLREDQSFTGAIGLLASCYDNSENLLVRKAVSEFMNDLKDQSAAPEVIAEIKKPWKPDTISMLVSSCWQSGLDYSQYIAEFAEIFFKGDYFTAIECLTVIEESADNITNQKREEVLRLVENHPLSPISEKSTLRLDLISSLNR